jgi:hypothetical protein
VIATAKMFNLQHLAERRRVGRGEDRRGVTRLAEVVPVEDRPRHDDGVAPSGTDCPVVREPERRPVTPP